MKVGGALAVVAWLALCATTAHADCLPAADLSGDPDTMSDVARALAALGVVAAEADGGCRAVEATVMHDPEGVAVSVRDPRGRIEGRVVADARTAAAWIESWADDDAAPLWSAIEVPPVKPIDPPPVTPVETAVVVTAPRPARRWRPNLAIDLGRDVASDGSTWDGLGVAGCVRVGRFCLGAAARYVVNGGYSTTDGLTAADRSATVATATASWPLQLARVELAPEIVLGAGWTSTRRHEPSAPCFNADGTPCPGMPLFIGDGFTTGTATARLGGGVALSVPLGGWLSLDARFGAELADGAHTDPTEPPPPPSDPTTDPNGNPPPPLPPGDPALALPGEPSWAWTAAVGLRIEVP